MFTYGPRVMQNPAVPIRDNEGIPVRQVDLIHVITIGMLFCFWWNGYSEAHGENRLGIRRERLRQVDGESLPAQVIIKGIAVQQNIFKRKITFEIWFHSQHKFIESGA